MAVFFSGKTNCLLCRLSPQQTLLHLDPLSLTEESLYWTSGTFPGLVYFSFSLMSSLIMSFLCAFKAEGWLGTTLVLLYSLRQVQHRNIIRILFLRCLTTIPCSCDCLLWQLFLAATCAVTSNGSLETLASSMLTFPSLYRISKAEDGQCKSSSLQHTVFLTQATTLNFPAWCWYRIIKAFCWCTSV